LQACDGQVLLVGIASLQLVVEHLARLFDAVENPWLAGFVAISADAQIDLFVRWVCLEGLGNTAHQAARCEHALWPTPLE
jgi:hypothetical protein